MGQEQGGDLTSSSASAATIPSSSSSSSSIPWKSSSSPSSLLVPSPHTLSSLHHSTIMPASTSLSSSSQSKASKRIATPETFQGPPPKKPMNCFFRYKKAKRDEIVLLHNVNKNSEISKVASEMWKREEPEVREMYEREAQEAFEEHKLNFPEFLWPSKGKSYQTIKKEKERSGAGTAGAETDTLLHGTASTSSVSSSSAVRKVTRSKAAPSKVVIIKKKDPTNNAASPSSSNSSTSPSIQSILGFDHQQQPPLYPAPQVQVQNHHSPPSLIFSNFDLNQQQNQIRGNNYPLPDSNHQYYPSSSPTAGSPLSSSSNLVSPLIDHQQQQQKSYPPMQQPQRYEYLRHQIDTSSMPSTHSPIYFEQGSSIASLGGNRSFSSNSSVSNTSSSPISMCYPGGIGMGIGFQEGGRGRSQTMEVPTSSSPSSFTLNSGLGPSINPSSSLYIPQPNQMYNDLSHSNPQSTSIPYTNNIQPSFSLPLRFYPQNPNTHYHIREMGRSPSTPASFVSNTGDDNQCNGQRTASPPHLHSSQNDEEVEKEIRALFPFFSRTSN